MVGIKQTQGLLKKDCDTERCLVVVLASIQKGKWVMETLLPCLWSQRESGPGWRSVRKVTESQWPGKRPSQPWAMA